MNSHEHWALMPPIMKAARGFRMTEICYVCHAAIVDILDENRHRANYTLWTKQVIYMGYADQCKEFLKTTTDDVVVLNWSLNVIEIK